MEIRLCPKCKAKNWPDKVVCAICNEPLDGVPLTPSRTGSSAATAPTIMQPSAAPQASAPNQTQQMGIPGPPMGAVTQMTPDTTRRDPSGLPPLPADYRPAYQPQAVYKEPSKLPIVVIGVMLAAGIAAALFYGMPKKQPIPTAPPEQTVTAFLEAKKTRNMDKVKPFISTASIEFLKNAFSSPGARSAGFDEAEVARMYIYDAPPSLKDLETSKITYQNTSSKEDTDAGKAVVSVTATTTMAILGEMSETTDFVMVPEDGKWKVDLPASQKRGLGKGPNLFPGGIK